MLQLIPPRKQANAQQNLVGGAITILKNMKVNGKDDNPYMKWKIKNVPNHRPVVGWKIQSDVYQHPRKRCR